MKPDKDPRENTYLRWAFWSLYYIAVKPFQKQATLKEYLTRGMRTMKPWWRWKPSLWHNAPGRQWHIQFENEGGVSSEEKIRCRVERNGNRITSLVIYDETLRGEPERT